MILKVPKPIDIIPEQPKTRNLIRKAREDYQIELLHNRIDIRPENIIEGKRVRKENSRYK